MLLPHHSKLRDTWRCHSLSEMRNPTQHFIFSFTCLHFLVNLSWEFSLLRSLKWIKSESLEQSFKMTTVFEKDPIVVKRQVLDWENAYCILWQPLQVFFKAHFDVDPHLSECECRAENTSQGRALGRSLKARQWPDSVDFSLMKFKTNSLQLVIVLPVKEPMILIKLPWPNAPERHVIQNHHTYDS